MKSKPILIVQGGQTGSEAKGAIALFLCQKLGVKWACRTGSINAGHSVIVDGKKIAFQQLPVATVLKDVNVVLGPGAYVHPETLVREMAYRPDGKRDVHVDHNCGVHLDSYARESKESGRTLRIGATGKGCAEAIIHKIQDRGAGLPLLLREYWDWRKYGQLLTVDTAEILTDAYLGGQQILIEGTQGSQLDLHTGPYPFTTSRQTVSAAWIAESGLSPALDYEVALVARTYPIRVAGNSGPMKNEISWPVLARRINARLKQRGHPPLVGEEAIGEFESCLQAIQSHRLINQDPNAAALHDNTDALARMSEAGRAEVLKLFEVTTVTKRLRRIAELDVEQLRLTVKKEQPAYLCLTFLDYEFPELAHERELHSEAKAYLTDLQDKLRCWIRYVSIGPRSEDVLETPGSFYRPYHWLQK